MEYEKTLNKGEWAEFYVLMKLLGEGKLYSANKLLQKNYQNYLDILKIIRQETKTPIIEYVINDADNTVTIIEKHNDRVLDTIPMKLFNQHADLLFSDITKKKGRSVTAPSQVCDFAKFIYVSEPKAPAVKSLSKQFGGKNDIFIQVRDPQTSLISLMGFSIKSKFADPPTLFNAGTTSQFLFELSGCDDDLMQKFNNIRKGSNRGWQRCKEFLKENGITLTFVDTKHQIYHDNLDLICESMPAILGWCVKNRLIDSDGDYEVKETIERLVKENPFGASNPKVKYEKFMKDFLMAGFTGMTAGKVWDGREQVNGGYICVMENGEVLCFHSNDREAFRDYLYKNTFFEYVSTDKYIWSYIEKDQGRYYLPLNASVRFCRTTR